MSMRQCAYMLRGFAYTPLWIAAALFACDSSTPLREWTPDDHGQPLRADPSRVPSAAEPESATGDTSARAARTLWSAVCGKCHGVGGKGDGTARPPGATLADLSDPAWHAQRTDAQITQAIREGRGMMPAFGKQLRPDGIDALVKHIRTLAPSAEPSTPTPKKDAAAPDAPAPTAPKTQ